MVRSRASFSGLGGIGGAGIVLGSVVGRGRDKRSCCGDLGCCWRCWSGLT